MKDVSFVTRADDAGSSQSANGAIAKVIRRGFIKNVSVMAPGAFLDQAAELLAGNKKVCFGMHGTLNAEWDKVKWKPVATLPKNNGLTDDNGYFLADPALFVDSKPPIELIVQEYEAQLDKLTRAGFDISYVDSHMLPEMYVAGMDEAIADFAKRKGLLDHMYYYMLPPGLLQAAQGGNLVQALRSIPDGQYFFVSHPALYSDEMLQTGNSSVSGEEIAKGRSGEAKLFGAPGIALLMRAFGIRPLRYDEAAPLEPRCTAADIAALLAPADAAQQA